jgi:ribonuclease HII
MSQRIPTLDFEQALWSRRISRVAGVDEAGRGAWAGPVVAGAVILPHPRLVKNWRRDAAFRALADARDSKLLSPAQRARLVEPIRAAAVASATGLASRDEIDALGIVPATRLAMERAVQALGVMPVALLIDAGVGAHGRPPLPDFDAPQKSIIHGDQLSLSIACASILAKVKRDLMMVELDVQWPDYGFAQHKGYGTAAHRAALEMFGSSAEHRMSFAPMKDFANPVSRRERSP